MNNHNYAPQTNNEPHENHTLKSDALNVREFSRNHRKGLLLGAGGLAATGILLAAGGLHDGTIDHTKAQETTLPTINEVVLEAVHAGPDSGDIITSTIEQGDAVSLVLEQSVSDLEKVDNLGFLKSQQGATLVSAQEIDAIIQKLTGGAPQPGDEVYTWRDNETGYIVSSVDTDKLVAPPQN